MNRNTTIVITVLVAGVAAAALGALGVLGVRTTNDSKQDVREMHSDESFTDRVTRAVRRLLGESVTDKAMAELRAQPLVGVVLVDNPAIEARVRAAVEEDQRNPQATSRAFLAIADIRRTVVGPTLSAADDASALAVMEARAALVAHLEKTDLAACRQFSGDGIRDINKLDGEGQKLFRAMLTAMEAAYRSGKANGGEAKPATSQEFSAMLQTAGFTPDDFAKFSQIATLKDDELCTLEFRIDDAPARLPDGKRGAFARFVIGH